MTYNNMWRIILFKVIHYVKCCYSSVVILGSVGDNALHPILLVFPLYSCELFIPVLTTIHTLHNIFFDLIAIAKVSHSRPIHTQFCCYTDNFKQLKLKGRQSRNCLTVFLFCRVERLYSFIESVLTFKNS